MKKQRKYEYVLKIFEKKVGIQKKKHVVDGLEIQIVVKYNPRKAQALLGEYLIRVCFLNILTYWPR